jgi:hypothetical protein
MVIVRQKRVICSFAVGCDNRWCVHRSVHRRRSVWIDASAKLEANRRATCLCSEPYFCMIQNKTVQCNEREAGNDYMKRLGL